ncbi:putative nucleoside-diphosphate sugar epimerase [uncultured Desulfobacterium sp.]|uniref:Putative nucleoside-diphosphate sugar epimerase n=1 Tax=uncultured Desulfobacterium sp. TaxID=201089 RepID=A0A445N010_9BACT|nr:putative nucleoside-diphosphate sugar epimerase [uncultured Desulfobacterium sp.]
MSDISDLFCYDLPTSPQPEIGKILVTGATGYIGGRLVPELVARGYKVRVMVRSQSPVHVERWPEAEIVVADALNQESLKSAFKDIHTTYYLIHSLLLGPKRFESADVTASINFRKAAEERGVRRIIYLGGLGDVRTPLSPHLRSRMEVARELKKGGVPVTILRAAVILGSGSTSYELFKNLVKKMPFVLIPYWAKTECQPIGIRDVIKYLVGSLETPETVGRSFDIGGKDVLTYEKMMKILADLLGQKKPFIYSSLSVFTPYAYLAIALTPVPAPIVWSLLEGIKSRVVCQSDHIRKIIPFEPLSCREAILRAMIQEEQDNVRTRWSDAYPRDYSLAVKLQDLKRLPKFEVSYTLLSQKDAGSLFKAVCMIGGNEGWFINNWAWRIRGIADRLLGGVGIARGRRSSSTLRINDVIDFWRVEDLKHNRRLLLRSEMILPGKAWLEFNIDPKNENNRLTLRAYYKPHGSLGRIYWYMFLPFHNIIFNGLLKQIERRG